MINWRILPGTGGNCKRNVLNVRTTSKETPVHFMTYNNNISTTKAEKYRDSENTWYGKCAG